MFIIMYILALCQRVHRDTGIGELSLMFQRQQHDLHIGMSIQNDVLTHDILTQGGQARLFRQSQNGSSS